jgi:hypothetical protein
MKINLCTEISPEVPDKFGPASKIGAGIGGEKQKPDSCWLSHCWNLSFKSFLSHSLRKTKSFLCFLRISPSTAHQATGVL